MRFLFLFLFSWFVQLPCMAQGGYGILRGASKVDIPFDYENDLMVVDVTFNQLFPLKFIFDTGAENTILSKKEVAELMGIPYEREFTVMGADMKTELTAYLIRNIHLRIGNAVLPRHPMLVLDDDYFRFEEVAGLEVHGILGADIFRGLIVKINYERRVITLYERRRFTPPKGYLQTPIEVFRNKAYLNTEVSVQQGEPNSVKLLLDSGAMVSVLLNTNTREGLELPENVLSGNIGAGLGGFIEGYLGRVSSLTIGEVQCKELLGNFQELSENVDTTIMNGRNGILGNKILSRFHLIFDYAGEVLYYKPNKKFNKKEEFDKSGLVIIATDILLNRYLIHDVLKTSPAEEAGLKKGDRILKINGTPTSFMSLGTINRRFRRKAGKKIRLVVEREGERLKFRFQLRSLI